MSTTIRMILSMLLAMAGANLVMAQSSSSGLGCDGGGFWRNRFNNDVCEVRELMLPATDSLSVDGGPNGGVRVMGWDRDEIRVRAEVRARARNDDDAQETLDAISIETDGVIRAAGPGGRNRSWNVTFEVMAPRNTRFRIQTLNGGISVADMRGDLDFEATNGGVSLDNVSANVHGHTINGGLSIEFDGESIDGDEFDVRTTNGGAVLRLPQDFSARLDAGTVNGGMHVDFPVTVQGRIGRQLTTTLGQGGPLLRVHTTNGGVHIGH